MKNMRIPALVLGLILITTGFALAGHIPNFHQVKFPFEGSEVLRLEDSGAGTYEGMGATWTFNDYDAQIVFDGTYLPGTTVPSFNLIWYFTGATMPLSVTITSATAGEYHIVPTIQATNDPDAVQDTSLAQWFVVGDGYFGHYFPDVYQVNLYISLENPNTAYDLTVSMEWGAGVATEPVSWDQVKSIYR